MKNRDYWIKRAEQVTESELKKSDDYLKTLEKQYVIATSEIQKEIDSWYRRYSQNNGISFLDAKKNLSSMELQELKWNVEEYIKYGEMNALNQMWMKELENASARVHITRLYSLQLQLKNHIEKLYEKNLSGSYYLLRGIYENSYYKSLFELQKGFNTGFKFMKFNEKELDVILNKPWANDGVNFSNRIWNDKSKLINELQTNLTQCIIRGENPNNVVNIMANRLKASKKNVRRIVMTESAYFSNSAQNQCYKDLSVNEYEVCSTLDSKTSYICQDMDGKVFKMSDYAVGVTAPPFHCHCRTCTVPYFNDEFTIGDKRAARLSNGNTEYISSDINYIEWRKKYIKENPNALIEEKKIKNKFTDKKQYEEYKKILGDKVPKSFDKFQDLKYNDINKWSEIKDNFKVVNLYKIDFGKVKTEKIIELDNLAFEAKKTRFDYAEFTGRDKKKIKNLANSGNFAIMEFGNKKYFAHSSINEIEDIEFKSINGAKNDFLLHKDNRQFKTLIINNIPRHYCTEAKMFEFVNDNIEKGYDGELTILSELDMCESCKGVLKQFKEKYPNAKVNIISGKEGVNWRKRK